MSYVATTNIPGYSPQDDDPPVFEKAADAWQWLASERARDDDAYIPENPDDPEGPQRLDDVVLMLEARARKAEQGLDLCGVIYGDTPGAESEWDLGIAYTVDWTDDE